MVACSDCLWDRCPAFEWLDSRGEVLADLDLFLYPLQICPTASLHVVSPFVVDVANTLVLGCSLVLCRSELPQQLCDVGNRFAEVTEEVIA